MCEKRYILTILVAVMVAFPAVAQLKCNYSSIDISTIPSEHVMLAGFAARSKASNGIHLPLRSSCLVLTDGKQKVCIISNDLMEVSPAVADTIITRISEASGLAKSNILFHCIHTHSAPRSGGDQSKPGGANYSWRQRMMANVVGNAVKTITDDKSFRAFSLQTGMTSSNINKNRCEKGGPVDHDVYAARLVDAKGAPICAFINLACHPVCMGPGSYQLSSDYSGVARNIISTKWGYEVFQLTGAAGNMDPAESPKYREYAERCGRQLATDLEKINFSTVPCTGTLAYTTDIAFLPYAIPEVTREDIKALADTLAKNNGTAFPRFVENVRDWEAQMLEEYDPSKRNYKAIEYKIAALNLDGVLMFFSQGEPFCEYQMNARAAFPQKTVFFAGYTGGQNCYLASERAFKVRKGYEYELEQMFVYTKYPYPLSSECPAVYDEAVFKTLSTVSGAPRYNIIPEPVSLYPAPGVFKLDASVVLSSDPAFNEVAADFASRVKTSTGISFKSSGSPRARAINIIKVEGLPEEAYRMQVTEQAVTVRASDRSGAFYALQTLCQLLPAGIYSTTLVKGVVWEAPCCNIYDQPRFAYRGMQLDCGRYFYPKEEIKKFIDLMAMHKQNYLQWHLTEDQGWRIEIKKYPRLTEVGAWRKETAGYADKGDKSDGKPHGGFYTQEDAREIVEYARRRCVNIIPEIELPGHSSAAIAAYPWLSCTPSEPKEVATTWGVKEDVYCPSDSTFKFLEDVFTELFDIFPCKYYHIGGDECPKTAWRSSERCKAIAAEKGLASVDDLQDYFVEHFDKFLRDHGKTVICWDEVLDGNPVNSTVVMSYRGHKPASEATRRKMQVIFCPNRWCYYDYDQEKVADTPTNEHLFIHLRKAYTWDYYSYVDSDIKGRIDNYLLGAQACVWGEHIPGTAALERQTYPREAAIAELCWTPNSKRNFNSFRSRVEKEFLRLDAAGIKNYSKAFWQVLVNMDLTSAYPRMVNLELDYPEAQIRYTTDGSEPTPASALYYASIKVKKGDTIKARGFKADGTPVGTTMTRTF